MSPQPADGRSNEPAVAPLRCGQLNAGYGESRIVSGVSLECGHGEIVAIIGPNGCGKSTLLKRLAGILPPSGGLVHLNGRDVTSESADSLARRGLHYVPQLREVFPSLTVRENLTIGAVDEHRVADVLARFPQLSALQKQRAGKLSGGERKILAIARALMRPNLSILLLDEPSAGVSPLAVSRLWPLIEEIAADGVGVLVVEQQVDAVLALASRAYVIVEGTIRLSGEAADLRARREELVDHFMGGATPRSRSARG